MGGDKRWVDCTPRSFVHSSGPVWPSTATDQSVDREIAPPNLWASLWISAGQRSGTDANCYGMTGLPKI